MEPKGISQSLCDLVKKECDIKPEKLISINELPANIQESILNEKEENKRN